MSYKPNNDAIIGNNNLKCTFSKKGELLRLFYPQVDFRQFIEYLICGIKVNDSSTIFLNNDVNHSYNSYFEDSTSIYHVDIFNSYYKLEIKCENFVLVNKNALVRKYKFVNKNDIELNVDFLIKSKLLSNENNFVSGKKLKNGLVQYTHDYLFSLIAKEYHYKSYRINNTEDYFNSGVLEQDKDYIGMSHDSSISYSIGNLKPEEEKEITIIIYLEENKTESFLEEELVKFKTIDIEKEKNKVIANDKELLDEYNTFNDIENNKKFIEKLKEYNISFNQLNNIIKRSIFLFDDLTNHASGGVAATVEVDEKLEHSGRYAYSWPRDAIFITKALDILKMNKITEKFYSNFCKSVQNRDGSFDQRFYTDGRLAPSWGYQIDETASIVYGVYEHYKTNNDLEFLNNNFEMCENAISFLKDYIYYNVEHKEDIGDRFSLYKKQSYDIWEMNEGIHAYSLAVIYSSFDAMINIYDTLDKENKNDIKELKRLKEVVQEFILNNLVNDQKCFKRSLEDDRMDMSLLGLMIPFKVFDEKNNIVQNTIEKINMTLLTYTNGYLRFEDDHYMNGQNPWPICSIWMALYYYRINDLDKVYKILKFVVETSNSFGFLAEQVDNNTKEPVWVTGLGWSHAMFILLLDKLTK